MSQLCCSCGGEPAPGGTDIVNSTPLVEAMGDDAWADLIRWHDRTLRAEFDAHGGEEVDHAGDGFFVAFPDPTRAVRAAVAIQHALADQRRSHGFAPGVRIGLHEAPARVDRDGYRGRGVHVAARVAGLAGAGEIVATTSTLDGVDAVTVDRTQARELKGVSGRIDVAWIDPSP